MPIPCPHFKITIVKRSQGQSAVAGAAYQSGERLFSEYDQKTKFYNKKKELVHAEVMLPSHAPPGFADRATLWNAVEAVENQWNSQLARRIVLAFPVEVPKEQYLSMIKEFCQEQFVAKGMIADFAIHDKGDGNPHAHILLTLRAMDAHGKWLPKARKVYDLDENGERIQLPSGNWRCHKENTVDWNDQKYAEVWRRGWETITNRYLEAAGRPERVDLRSFERQDIQQIHHHIAHIHARIGKPSIKDKHILLYEHNAFTSHLMLDSDEVYQMTKRGLDAAQISAAKRIHLNLVLVKLLELHHLGYDLRHYHAQHHAFIKQFNLPAHFQFDVAVR